jgi:hypothetical protein
MFEATYGELRRVACRWYSGSDARLTGHACNTLRLWLRPALG